MRLTAGASWLSAPAPSAAYCEIVFAPDVGHVDAAGGHGHAARLAAGTDRVPWPSRPPLSASIENCATVPLGELVGDVDARAVAAHRDARGREPAATGPAAFGVSAPVVVTSYCETVPSVKLVT